MNYQPQTPLVEQWHAGGFIVSQAPGHQSFDRASFDAGLGRLLPGLVIAERAASYTATGTAVSGNKGDGKIEDIAATSPAIAGVYLVTFVSPNKFQVTNPYGELIQDEGGHVDFTASGIIVGYGKVNQVFNAQGIGFKITEGSTPFAAGDTITITVTKTGGGWEPLTSSLASASPVRYGLLYGLVDAENNLAYGTVFVRNGEVNLSELVWDPSLTAAQQNAALEALRGQGVIPR